jgi:hypothetical protein
MLLWLQNQTDPPWQPQLIDDQGNIFVLTGYAGSALTLKMVNQDTQQVKSGGGIWTIYPQDAQSGIATYQWAISDVNTAGTWLLYVSVATLAGQNRRFPPETMNIESAP